MGVGEEGEYRVGMRGRCMGGGERIRRDKTRI